MSGNIFNSEFPFSRGRRIRKSQWIRDLTSENELSVSDLVLPMFLKEDSDANEEIAKMPGIKRFSLSQIVREIEEIDKLGIKAIALFPKVSQSLKTNDAKESFNPNNLVCRALKVIRKEFPKLGVICDVALDAYTLSGHDGLLDKNGCIENDKTNETLSKMALNFSDSGC
jgi:porphobilinogen synthase